MQIKIKIYLKFLSFKKVFNNENHFILQVK